MATLLSAGRLPGTVRVVNLAGEPLQSELVEQIYDLWSVQRVYDLYGPSETTTYSTFSLRTAHGPATIGRPISNTQVYLFDSNLQPVPIGVPGELCIGGGGVARGYLNRPELTTEKFIEYPLNDAPSLRLYRTGDLARYLPDGNIEFLGRRDNQVKIRGYRIEPGEIEAALNQHPAVKDSVVVARARGSAREKDLIGYVVPKAPSTVSVAELRSFLRAKLPEFMVPPVLIPIAALPLTLNGKIDRNALAPANDSGTELEETSVEPRTQGEELVAQIWREVLKLESIGVHQSFFELGGHSLLAVQIVARLRAAFDREIAVRVLFDAPTVADLAATMDDLIRGGRYPDVAPIVAVPRDQPLPLSLNQEHLWRLDKMFPGTHYFNMPYVYRLSGDLDVAALERALGEIIRRHEALRTVFAEVDGSPVQIIKDGCMFQLPVEDLRDRPTDDLSQQAAVLLLEERERHFDLATGPLIRTKLLRLTDRESFLLITMHHIISDHSSLQVFRHELVKIYHACSEGRPSPFGDLPVQFADYAVWEKQSMESGILDRHWDYWKQQLSVPLPEFELKNSSKQNNQQSFRFSRQPIEIDETLFTGIKSLAARENCTPFMVVLAALNLVLYYFTGQQEVRIGTLVANRRCKEIENLIGHFVNTVILRTRLSAELNVRNLLRRVREVTLEAYAHQEFPFEQLARMLEKERGIERESLFGVLLSYQNSWFESEELPGLKFASIGRQLPELDSAVTLTAHDLIVNLRETSTGLTGSVNYKIDTLDNDVVASMVKRFARALEEMVVDTEKFVVGSLYDGDIE
jgi:acyl carrier protein